MVTMTHPNIPGRELQAQDSAVATYERSGWEVKTESVPAPAGDAITQKDGEHDGDSA